MNDTLILKRFYKFLVDTIPGCVIKYTSEAKKYETVESKRAGDHFVAASLGTDSLIEYPRLSVSVLEKSGCTAEEIKLYKDNPMSVPREKAKTVLYNARKEFIQNYNEQNNYYRRLNGLPDISDDAEEIWLDDYSIYDLYGLEPCPVHEIPHKYLKALEENGVIEELKKAHPNATYLDYLGSKKIDIVSARRADNYEMLYLPNVTDSYSFYRNFLLFYDECRQYFLTVVYNQFFSSKYDEYYDGYIGFMIMVMTINRMIVSNFKVFVERDFYDEYSTKLFLSAYGVPCSSRFTLSQLKILAKNLNIILRMKETDLALLDVMDLMDYSNFTLSRYYLIRQQNMDEDGNPKFEYKLDEETGEMVVDKDSTYNYHFTRVPVTDNNIQEALRNGNNRMTYTSVTSEDKYWIEDKELQDKIRNTKFNYIETKYMDLSIVYRMHAILFETVYLTRMILDKHKETKLIRISMAKLSPIDMPLFDIMVFLICLMCKFYHIDPTLMNTPSKILHIAGFNFDADIEAIRQDIQSHPDIYNQEVLKYIDDVIFTKPDDINNFYVKIKNLDVVLTRLINKASTLESYRAYRNLYDTLMYINLNNTIYALPDGSIPERFTEYLQYANPSLYSVYESLESDDDVSNLIAYMTSRLSTIFTSTKYLSFLQTMDTSLIDAVVKLVCYFKSLTVDMRGVDVILLFDSRVMNGAHFYYKLKFGDEHLQIDDRALNHTFWSIVQQFDAYITATAEVVPMEELERIVANWYTPDKFNFMHKLVGGKESLQIDDRSNAFHGTDMLLGETVTLDHLIDQSNIEDLYRFLSVMGDANRLFTREMLKSLTSDNLIKNVISTDACYATMQIALTLYPEKVSVKDTEYILTNIFEILRFHYKDKLANEIASIETKEHYDAEERVFIQPTLYLKDKVAFSHELLLASVNHIKQRDPSVSVGTIVSSYHEIFGWLKTRDSISVKERLQFIWDE